jgi:hypothetical protein
VTKRDKETEVESVVEKVKIEEVRFCSRSGYARVWLKIFIRPHAQIELSVAKMRIR